MGLFTNPVAVSDGTDTRTFAYRAQLSNVKTVGADYIESAASSAAKSLIVVKHDLRTPIVRNLLQRTHRVHPEADTDSDDLKAITVNLTITAHEDFSEAEIQKEVNILVELVGEANFVKSMRSGII
jgi:hypothetical protein